jgi:hypothetical protein
VLPEDEVVLKIKKAGPFAFNYLADPRFEAELMMSK